MEPLHHWWEPPSHTIQWLLRVKNQKRIRGKIQLFVEHLGVFGVEGGEFNELQKKLNILRFRFYFTLFHVKTDKQIK